MPQKQHRLGSLYGMSVHNLATMNAVYNSDLLLLIIIIFIIIIIIINDIIISTDKLLWYYLPEA